MSHPRSHPRSQGSQGISADINGLLPILQWLDRKFEQALASHVQTNPESTTNRDRGLLSKNPESTEPLIESITIDDAVIEIRPDSPLAWLHQTFDLSAFDLLLVAIALAPELDRRYEQMYAYLQDDIRYKRPTVDLALDLLCPNPTEKLSHRTHFSNDSPLIQHRLLHLIALSEPSKPTTLGRELHLDEQVINLLIGQTGIDSRLAAYAHLVHPQISLDRLPLSSKIKQGLTKLTLQYWEADRVLWLYFQGTDRTAKRHTAEALAKQAQVPLLAINLSQLVTAKIDFEPALGLLLREAWFQNAWIYFDDLDTLSDDKQLISYRSLFTALADVKVITILSGNQSLIPSATGSLGIITIPFEFPDFEQRRDYWQTCLDQAGITISDSDLEALSDRFRLTSEQITNAVAISNHTSQWQIACDQETGLPIHHLFTAARSQSGHDLASLSQKIVPKYGWNDIVLPPQQLALLQELCNEAKYQHLVWNTWGFDRKLSLGKGLNILFSGSPGTGKTMAAEVIAKELQLDLYKIDLSQIVSKYIGETEKSLNQVFTSASNSNAILFFDEADALFGKRSEVRDAHDRYANIETSYLLQKMEEYEGIAILTTNFRSNIDEAFSRRLRFIIEFALPGVKERRCIWERICPEQMPLSQDIDFDFLARQFELAGANIRNVVLRAAFLAADDKQGEVTMRHITLAIRREYQKMGKILMLEELGEYANLL